ncbi:PILS5 [Symbiodinium pilosum]|uniref:PILS5 protein n=1 Tax=Symbiodinium pilosum TaxID=2952 RepID=A0A812MBY8_SYMPI|nr:PILS5 [Symbiodinium pilosum]
MADFFLRDTKWMDPLQRLPVYLMLYPVLQWSIGSWLLSEAAPSDAAEGDLEAEEVESVASSDTSLDLPERKRCLSRFADKLRTILEKALVPPVIGALLGLLAGFTPARGWLVDLRDQDNDAPLQWLYSGLYKLGDAAVPVNLLILGSSLAKGADFNALPLRVGLAIAVSKLILMPGLMIPIVYGLIRIIPSKEFSLWLVVLVVSCTPTANNVAVMAQSGGQSKEGMATAIFIQYLLAPICVTLSLAGFIQLLSSDWFLPPS